VDLGVSNYVDGHVFREDKVLCLDDVLVLAEGVYEVGEGGVILEVELFEAVEGVDGVLDKMRGNIALKDDTECGVVGGRGGAGVHAANEVPTEIELEELGQDVEYEVEGVGGVAKVAVGVSFLHPVEELQGSLPIIVEGEQRLADGGLIGRRRRRKWPLCDGGCG